MTSTKLTVLAGAAAAAAIVWCVVTAPGWFLLGVIVLAAAAALVTVIRFVQLPPEARRYWPAARWHKFTWLRLARNLGLALVDAHLGGVGSSKAKRVNCPRAHFKPDPFGFVVSLKLVPGVSRAEVEKAAEHLGNAWGAWRVGITQTAPNRLRLRAMRRDPLAEPLGSHVLPEFDGRHLMLGRDEWGELRSASLAGIAGSVLGVIRAAASLRRQRRSPSSWRRNPPVSGTSSTAAAAPTGHAGDAVRSASALTTWPKHATCLSKPTAA
jgi:hypothetical protein